MISAVFIEQELNFLRKILGYDDFEKIQEGISVILSAHDLIAKTNALMEQELSLLHLQVLAISTSAMVSPELVNLKRTFRDWQRELSPEQSETLEDFEQSPRTNNGNADVHSSCQVDVSAQTAILRAARQFKISKWLLLSKLSPLMACKSTTNVLLVYDQLFLQHHHLVSRFHHLQALREDLNQEKDTSASKEIDCGSARQSLNLNEFVFDS